MKSIPKIIHQIWWQGFNNLPSIFKTYHQSWVKLHPNWEIIIWDQKKVINLLKKYYPKLLNLLENYPYMIQKIDMAKYVILYHYGGFYVDMDTEANQSLNNLINDFKNSEFNFVCSQMEIIPFIKIVNNGIIFSKAKHPILLIIINNLNKYSKKKFYHNQDLYILESTGPIFFHQIIDQYYYSKILILPPNYLESCNLLDYQKCNNKGKFMTHHHTLSWASKYFRKIFE